MRRFPLFSTRPQARERLRTPSRSKSSKNRKDNDHGQTKNPAPDLEFSPQAAAAFDRVTDLAHRLAAGLLGEELSPEGRVQTHRAQAMVMSMGYFLFRIGPDDLHALFFAEGSLNQVEFVPMPAEADARIKPLFPDWRFLRMYPPEEYELP